MQFQYSVVVKVNKAIQVYIGQGEGETKWNGCAWKLLLLCLTSLYCLSFQINKIYISYF